MILKAKFASLCPSQNLPIYPQCDGKDMAVESWAGPQGQSQTGPSGARNSNGPHPFSRHHTLLCTAITLLLDGNALLHTCQDLILDVNLVYLVCRD